MKHLMKAIVLTAAMAATQSHASDGGTHAMNDKMMSPGLLMPNMDAERGRVLFAEKGCVVCHSVNGVGGEDAPMLDADTMDEVMNPFEFAARMWRGAGAMVALQEDELGGQIDLSGQELADIIAFVHDAAEQRNFSKADIPHEIEEMMHHEGEDDHHEEGEEDDHG
ncbi:c-type cytochrome [Primorskyibacter aestuariivivens]|uniref:c-type cytochrome n=1 Tax=Primorskyibacter aestuariivivens TaxID=1888912 RepID=UPI002300F631|nr:c-type cytochrome [Primorskyibacter aestuariivivens]MDA7429202.1 c-type cytochrome [Primorskyibacter aestuariivivens]